MRFNILSYIIKTNITMMKPIYKKADISEIDSICELIKNAIRQMESQGIYQWDEDYPNLDILSQDITNEELTTVNIENEIAAIYVTNTEYDEEYDKVKWHFPDAKFMIVHRLCVSPKFQNKGLARIIVEHIEKEAKQKGFQSIRLDTFSGNPYSLRLYKSLGYTETGHFFWRKGCLITMEKLL